MTTWGWLQKWVCPHGLPVSVMKSTRLQTGTQKIHRSGAGAYPGLDTKRNTHWQLWSIRNYQLTSPVCLWAVGGNRSTRGESTQRQGKHTDFTQNGPSKTSGFKTRTFLLWGNSAEHRIVSFDYILILYRQKLQLITHPLKWKSCRTVLEMHVMYCNNVKIHCFTFNSIFSVNQL